MKIWARTKYWNPSHRKPSQVPATPNGVASSCDNLRLPLARAWRTCQRERCNWFEQTNNSVKPKIFITLRRFVLLSTKIRGNVLFWCLPVGKTKHLAYIFYGESTCITMLRSGRGTKENLLWRHKNLDFSVWWNDTWNFINNRKYNSVHF